MTNPVAQSDLDATFAAAQVSPWTLRQKVGRVLWMLVQATAFRWSFHSWYGWRAFLLRLFGAKVGRHVHIRSTARIEIPWNLRIDDYSSIGDFAIVYCLGPVSIGRRATISQYAHLCAGTHDFSRIDMPLLRPPIGIGDDAWIATDAFVGPGVVVGEGAILGARASAFSALDAWTIYAGNPARALRPRPRPEPRP